ncbi:MAG: peptide-methionine (R)-S-oxide reductase MsrB [Pyrinomonadaceae bacterium]
MQRRFFLFSILNMGAAAVVCKIPLAGAVNLDERKRVRGGRSSVGRVVKSDAEWKSILTPEQYEVMRQKGTEAPGSSPLLNVHENGVFECVGCALPLFSSKTKFESHTGWPSFWAPIARMNVRETVDKSLSESRTEISCARCDAHQGHVFGDGPAPTGLRYCMNGVALKFVKKNRAA